MTVIFRRLTTENYQPAYAVHQQVNQLPRTEQSFVSCLSANYFAYAATLQSKCIGYYLAMLVADEVTLIDTAVAFDSQRKGIGSQLIQHLVTQSIEKSAKMLWLEVRESNRSAIELYKKTGFTQVEIRKNYYPTSCGRESALIMRQIL